MASYLTLFGWSFLAATIVPLGSEPALVVLIRQGYSFPAVVLVATAGNYLGACTTYGLGRAAARVLRPEESSRTAKRAAELVARYGPPRSSSRGSRSSATRSWPPPAVARMPFLPFSLWALLGKAGRYLAVAWGARALLAA